MIAKQNLSPEEEYRQPPITFQFGHFKNTLKACSCALIPNFVTVNANSRTLFRQQKRSLRAWKCLGIDGDTGLEPLYPTAQTSLRKRDMAFIQLSTTKHRQTTFTSSTNAR